MEAGRGSEGMSAISSVWGWGGTTALAVRGCSQACTAKAGGVKKECKPQFSG